MKLKDTYFLTKGVLTHRRTGKPAGRKNKFGKKVVMFNGVKYFYETLVALYHQEIPTGLDTKMPTTTFSGYPVAIYSANGVQPYPLVGAITTPAGQLAMQWGYDGLCIDGDPDKRLIN
jgi:hypothetical protein